ncbi:YfiR family protein [Corallincola platygyrae]|uniref:YfiR family protein n=1 Tax=Corallincola platygyrae TaxID=1193278 RepID=A0ABW4XHD9_9GAMM
MAMVMLLLGLPKFSMAAQADRFSVQAALLQKISHLMAWPEKALKNTDRLNICVLGNRATYEQFTQVYRNISFFGKSVDSTLLDRSTPIDSCHILYFDTGFKKEASQFARNNQGKPILMVGTEAGLASAGVHLNFIVKKGRVMFELNRSAMTSSGFKVSPQLLKYASVVER